MAQLEIDGVKFDTGTINAIEQFDVFIKIAPLLASFIKLRLATQRPLPQHDDPEARQAEEEKRKGEIGGNVEALAIALSKTPKADSDFILETCLLVCKKQIGGGWHPVWAKGAGLTDQSLPLMTMLRLVWTVLEENLKSFFDSAALILTNFIKTAK